MAKKSTAKGASGAGKKVQARKTDSSDGGSKRRSERSSSNQSDPVDALIRLLQSPLVIDLLAVGATAALATITEHRSSRAQGAMGNSKKALKAAGKAAAAAMGRRLQTEFEQIRSASKRTRESSDARADAAA